MENFFNALNNFFLIALPYIALFVFVIGSIWRYRSNGFKFSSLSSQFLEGRQLFWGQYPFISVSCSCFLVTWLPFYFQVGH